MTRRDLGSAATLLSAVAFVGLGEASASAAEFPAIRYVVTDRRYPETLKFGAILEGRGSTRLEVTDGLTSMWRDALSPLWQGASGSVAGLTTPEVLACLIEQARSCGRRSSLVGHHLVSRDGPSSAHAVSLNRPVPNILAVLERSGETWPKAMAEFVSRYPLRTGGGPTVSYRSETSAAASNVFALTSWIIA